MPGPMPPQGAPAPQKAPQAAPQAPQKPQGGGGGAADVVAQISDGYQKLHKMMEGAGGAVSPEDKQLLGQSMNSFQALIEALSKPAGQAPQAPQGPAQPKGPMPANAGPGSKPMAPGQ